MTHGHVQTLFPAASVVTARRDKAAALKLLKRILKKYGPPRSVVTDGSYSAAMKEIGAADRHELVFVRPEAFSEILAAGQAPPGSPAIECAPVPAAP